MLVHILAQAFRYYGSICALSSIKGKVVHFSPLCQMLHLFACVVCSDLTEATLAGASISLVAAISIFILLAAVSSQADTPDMLTRLHVHTAKGFWSGHDHPFI